MSYPEKEIKLLLHTCCAPCASSVLERLLPEYQVSLFYFNPNIQPEQEYYQRLNSLRTLGDIYQLELIEPEYEPEKWFGLVKGYENEPEKGARCGLCFQYRLEYTAAEAKKRNMQLFATTLTVSPHKDADLINFHGRRSADKFGVKYLISDFKQDGGYKKSIELSKKHGLYRQNYCGCTFSLNKSSTT